MTDNTKIEWTDATFNPWWGCVRVSPACRNCYADSTASRWGHNVWRKNGPRRMMSDANWAKPIKWNRDAEKTGVPTLVFCASMADVFEDHPDVTEPRKRLWDLIAVTPHLRWQILTKRPENIAGMSPWTTWPDYVHLGTSVETQRFAEQRIPHLLAIDCSVRFLSCEPLLGPLDLKLVSYYDPDARDPATGMKVCGGCSGVTGIAHEPACGREPGEWWGIDWVIAGGESGPKARRTDPEWFRSVRDQCRDAGVPFMFKQAGAVLAREWGGKGAGADPAAWPEAFPREYPVVSS